MSQLDLSKYNPVAQELLDPFDDAEIAQREGSGGKTFSYVPPEIYRQRLLRVFSEGYTFKVTNVEKGKTGISGSAYFKGTHSESGVVYEIEIPVFEPYKVGAAYLWNNDTKKRDIPNPKAGEILDPEHAYASLASAGIKAISREMGLGLHLYEKSPQTRTSSGSNNSSPASYAQTSGPWNGEAEVTIGQKWKGRKWSEVDDSYLGYLTKDPDPSKHNQLAVKELARRKNTGLAAATANVQAAQSADDDDDSVPF